MGADAGCEGMLHCAVFSSAAVANGVVLEGSSDNNLYAHDATTGKLVWKFKTKDQVYGSVTVADGVAFVGSFDNSLYAVHASTGKLKWKHATKDSIESTPAVMGG